MCTKHFKLHVYTCTLYLYMWFHYPGLLLHTELMVSLFIRCTMICEIWAKPSLAAVGRALCLEYRVSWVRVPPEAAHFF